MNRLMIFIVISLMLVQSGLAAEIYGAVYGPSLNKVKDLVIEIDSSPVQRLVSRTGEYSFNVNPGRNYTISAKMQNKIVAQESVFLSEEGRFILDLFILPDFSEDDEIFFEADEPALEESLFSNGNNWLWIVLIIVGGGAAMVIFKKKLVKKNKIGETKEVVPSKTDLDVLVEIIKKEGGRITQKELRKHFPLSEAKISLMIAELEAKGKVEKIKQGRGNIIILK